MIDGADEEYTSMYLRILDRQGSSLSLKMNVFVEKVYVPLAEDHRQALILFFGFIVREVKGCLLSNI